MEPLPDPKNTIKTRSKHEQEKKGRERERERESMSRNKHTTVGWEGDGTQLRGYQTMRKHTLTIKHMNNTT